MRPDNHTKIIPLQEGIQIVSAKIDHIILFLRVSDEIVLETCYILTFMRITPKKIDDFLMVVDFVWAQGDFERSLDLFDVFDVRDCRADAAVAAEDTLLLISNNSRQRQIVKSVIDFGKAAVGVSDILVQSFGAFFAEAKVLIDMSILMITSQKHYLPRKLQF